MKKLYYTLALLCGLSTAAFAQVPNPGFESWDSLSIVNNKRIYNPTGWFSTNADMVGNGFEQPVTMSTDARTGTYAVQITASLDDAGKQAAILSTGSSVSFDFSKDQGEKIALQGKIKSFQLYYKYLTAINDSFMVYLAMYKDGQYYGQAYTKRGQANTYQKLLVELNYPSTVAPPDSAKLFIFASTQNNAGSILTIDDVSIGYANTGIANITKKRLGVYPNPAKNNITVSDNDMQNASYKIIDNQGQVAQEGILENNQINTANLTQGVYMIQMETPTADYQQVKFIKE
ncbi:MAG: T9SS type A sorting domain-containing protein [Bacteroidota bacterium]